MSSNISKMMVARSTGDAQSKRQIGFDMRSVEERRGGGYARGNDSSNMRMGGREDSEMRMGGYDAPESVRRSPRTGRFVKSEMSGGYEARGEHGTNMRMGEDSRMSAYGMEGGRQKHGGMTSGSSHYREHDDDEEDEDMEFSEEIAHKWTKAMKNEDGSTGPHWTKEQTRAVMVQQGIVCDPMEFFAIMNSLYSDYSAVAKKFGVDRAEFYAHLAKAWLDDKDAVDDKAAAYYACIVKHKDNKHQSTKQ